MTVTRESQALRRWFTIGALIIVVAAIALILWPLRVPLAWAAMLAFLMTPLHKRLTRQFGNRPNASAGLLTALTPIAIFAPLTLIGIAFAQQITSLANVQRNPLVRQLLGSPREPTSGLFPGSAAIGCRHPELRPDEPQPAAWAGAVAGFSARFPSCSRHVPSLCLMLFICSSWCGRQRWSPVCLTAALRAPPRSACSPFWPRHACRGLWRRRDRGRAAACGNWLRDRGTARVRCSRVMATGPPATFAGGECVGLRRSPFRSDDRWGIFIRDGAAWCISDNFVARHHLALHTVPNCCITRVIAACLLRTHRLHLVRGTLVLAPRRFVWRRVVTHVDG